MNEFDDLRQIREAKEKAEALARQKQLEEERRKAEAAQRLQERKAASADKLHGMVVEILKALRDAVYPGCEVQRIWSPEWGWGIGVVQEDWETGKHFYPRLKVVLEFDADGNPRRFCVHRDEPYSTYYKSVTCGLNNEELTRSLRKLHPPSVVEKIRPC